MLSFEVIIPGVFTINPFNGNTCVIISPFENSISTSFSTSSRILIEVKSFTVKVCLPLIFEYLIFSLTFGNFILTKCFELNHFLQFNSLLLNSFSYELLHVAVQMRLYHYHIYLKINLGITRFHHQKLMVYVQSTSR